MRPLLWLGLAAGVFVWLAPSYTTEAALQAIAYYLTGGWWSEISNALNFPKWYSECCTFAQFSKQVAFWHFPLLVGVLVRGVAALPCFRTGVDWFLRFMAAAAAVQTCLTLSMFQARYLDCPEGKHGGACKTIIEDGVNSLVVLEWWLDTVWLRVLTAVFFLAEGWRVRMAFHRVALYSLCSLLVAQIVAWPLWMLEYRQLQRVNDVLTWFDRALLDSAAVKRLGLRPPREESEEERRAVAVQEADSTNCAVRRASLLQRLEPGSHRCALQMRGVVSQFVRAGVLHRETVAEAQRAVENPVPGTQACFRSFPQISTENLFGAPLKLAYLIPLFYLYVSVASSFGWLTWMNEWVRTHCWLDGFLNHVFDNPATFMMYSGPFFGVFVCVVYIWVTEPCFRTKAEVAAGEPIRWFQLFWCYFLSVLAFQNVAWTLALYLGWREFRLQFLRANVRGLRKADATVWQTSASLDTYLQYDRLKARRERRAAAMKLLRAGEPASPAAGSVQPAEEQQVAAAAVSEVELQEPADGSKADEGLRQRVTRSGAKNKKKGGNKAAAQIPSAPPLTVAQQSALQPGASASSDKQIGVIAALLGGLFRAVSFSFRLLAEEVQLSLEQLGTFLWRVWYSFRHWIGFSPLPTPSPRSSFLDWSLLVPWMLLTWTLALNCWVVCWMCSVDVSTRGYLSSLSMFVAFVLVLRGPEKARAVYQWLMYEPAEERAARLNLLSVHGDAADKVAVPGLVSGANEDPQLRVNFNPHLLWTLTTGLLFSLSTVLVIVESQLPLPWINNVYRIVRQTAVDNIHRGPSATANQGLLLVTALLAYTLFFGFRLLSPSRSRGMPLVTTRTKLAIVWPLFFIFAVVWPSATLPCNKPLGVESPQLTERDFVDMEAAIREAIRERAKGAEALRPVHPKTHGCVKGELSLPYYLPPKYRFGLFADDAQSGLPLNYSASTPIKRWSAFVRFSNGGMAVQQRDGSWALQPDSVPDVRGMAVKILLPANNTEPMSLTEDQIRAGATDRSTQDLLTITSDYFFQEDGASYASFIKALASTDPSLMLNWLKPPSFSLDGFGQTFRRMRTLWLALRMNRDGAYVKNPLRAEYFSAVPYRLGPDVVEAANNMRPVMAVKYRWRPCTPSVAAHVKPAYVLAWLQESQARVVGLINSVYRVLFRSTKDLLDLPYFHTREYREAQVAKQNPTNFLRINLQDALDPFDPSSEAACFDLMLQDQTDACVNSVEDSTRVWQGEWIRAARLLIPPQSFLSTKQLEFCENLSFQPWHSLAAHHPLGDVNKLRRSAYMAAAQERRILNGVPLDYNGTVYTGNELDAVDVPNATQSTNLRGNPAAYAYSSYPPPFQALPKKIESMPFSEQMSNATTANIRARAQFAFLAQSYPQAKLHGEFRRVQDYQFLELSRPDEPVLPNTNHAVSGRLRRNYHVDENVWTSDVWWARQFIQGLNPMLIQRVTSVTQLPKALVPLSDAQRQRVAQQLAKEDLKSMDALAKAGRLFYVDYEQIENIMTYQERILYAPIVVFYLSSTPGRPLLPLFIQLDRGTVRPALYFPAPYVVGAESQSTEALAWLFARMHVSSADAIVHQLIFHLLDTHLAMEPVIIAAHRAFTPSHPLLRLLKQHFTGTLAINDFGRVTLVADMHAQVDELLATGLQGSMQLMAKTYNTSYRFMETVPDQLRRRGFAVPQQGDRSWGADSDELPGFLYRDYSLALWYEMRTYVHDVLDSKYGKTKAERDANFKADVEIIAWLKELHDPSSAAIKQHKPLNSFDDLVEFVTQIIFQGSAQHAAVNFGQYDLQSFQPARPLFLTRGMPADLSVLDEQYIVSSLMPSKSVAMLLSLFDILSACCVNTLMLDDSQSAGMILDDAPPTQPAFPDQYERFKERLRKLEADMRAYNNKNSFHYPYLYPSRVPQSIAI